MTEPVLDLMIIIPSYNTNDRCEINPVLFSLIPAEQR